MKLSDYEFSLATRKDTNLLGYLNDIFNLLNNGRYQMRVVTSVPTWTGEQGEHLLYISGTVRRFYFWDDTNSTWQFIEWNNSSISQSTIVATVSLTGQAGNIGTTTLYTPAASGIYKISVYHLCTTAGSAGTLATTIGWTDDVQAQTVKPAGDINLNGAGNAAAGISPIRSTATAITYSAAIAGGAGSPQYALFIVVERLT